MALTFARQLVFKRAPGSALAWGRGMATLPGEGPPVAGAGGADDSDEPDPFLTALSNTEAVLREAFEERDPDQIMFAKSVASEFVEQYTERSLKLPAEQRAVVDRLYGAKVEAVRKDLLRLFRLRDFNG